jgi:histidinol-phosphate aminotransferase
MSRYFRPNIAALAGYVPGEQPENEGKIKLNTNENPYPPSPKVFAALREAINPILRLYPEPLADGLRRTAAQVYGVQRENILAGNGSDEILSILLRSFVGAKDCVAFPVPTYSLYETLVAIQEGELIRIDYPADFTIPPQLCAQKAALTLLCNPNSPSGTLVPLTEIERLARALTGIVVVDEAYIDFAANEAASAIPLIQRMPNLIVLRTFSKSFSLAGMRIGLAFACEELIAGMMKVKDSYNLNRLSAIAATAALHDLPWMKRNVRRIQRSRETLSGRLKQLGYEVHPSQANFVLAKVPGGNERPTYEALKARNIFVRYFDTPGLRDSLRISIGTPDEMKMLVHEMALIRNHGAA